MGDFRKKYPVDWFRGGKVWEDIPGKNNILHWKNISLMTYIMLKKNLAMLHVRKKISNSSQVWEKKFLPKLNHLYPSPRQKSNGQPHRGWGRSWRIWHLSRCHPSTKWLVRVHHAGVPYDGSLLNTLKTLFDAISSTFRYLEMYSKRRYKICICSVILRELDSFWNYEGFSIIFPKILHAL